VASVFYQEDDLLLLLTGLPGWPRKRLALAAIYRIKTEAFEHSKVMDHAFYGPFAREGSSMLDPYTMADPVKGTR